METGYSNKPGMFTEYELSPKEEQGGRTLNLLQRMYLHNLRSLKVQAKLNMKFTPESLWQFTQDEAYVTGQIELLSAILDDVPDEVTDETQPKGE